MLIVATHAHLFSSDEYRYPPKKNPSRPPAGTGTLVRREGTEVALRKEVQGPLTVDGPAEPEPVEVVDDRGLLQRFWDFLTGRDVGSTDG